MAMSTALYRWATAPRAALSAVTTVTAVSLTGAVVAVRSGLAPSYRDALGPQGRLSVPLPMTAFQVVTALAAASQRRTAALPGSGLLALAVGVAVVSGFFDGGYTDERLSKAQRGYQMVLVASLGVVGVAAALRFRQLVGAPVAYAASSASRRVHDRTSSSTTMSRSMRQPIEK